MLLSLLSVLFRISGSSMDTLIEYRPGNTNLILSVPHGGSIMLDEIADRIKCCKNRDYPQEKCFNTTDGNRCMVVLYPDSGTISIANNIQKILASKGKSPHIVINHLHRIKLDVNRNIDEAAQGDPKAIRVYEEYHAMLERVKGSVKDGLVIDVHGQSHVHNLTELGYLRVTDQLNAQDYNATNSSIRHLSETTGLSGEELMTGPNSLGALLERNGFGAIPSPNDPYPGERKYYAGGHITRQHGSREGGSIDCIQIEMPLIVRKKTSPLRENFTAALAEALYEYHEQFYSKN